MNLIRVSIYAVIALLICAVDAMAQGAGSQTLNSASVGAGMILIGAGFGFGKIGSAAMESMARQPEVAKDVGGRMILIAALLEGAAFFALIVCFVKG